MALYSRIIDGDNEVPRDASDAVVDLLSRLLEKDPSHRIGSLAKGERDILDHAWFADDLDLQELRQRQVEAPWVPHLSDPMDTSCFDDWDDLVDKMDEEYDASTGTGSLERNLFADF